MRPAAVAVLPLLLASLALAGCAEDGPTQEPPPPECGGDAACLTPPGEETPPPPPDRGLS